MKGIDVAKLIMESEHLVHGANQINMLYTKVSLVGNPTFKKSREKIEH